MFARISRLLTLKNTRKAGLIALPLAAVTMITPFALADDWKREGDSRRGRSEYRERGRDWGHDRGHDRGRGGTSIVIRPEIVIGRPHRPEVVVIEKHRPRQRVEVAPYDIAFKAYQSEDRIIVNIEGSNRSSGFTTTLSSRHEGVVEVCNLAPMDHCAQVVTPFCMTASITACRPMHSITVKVAGRTYTVPVTQAQALS
jgi:hypothetical protein